MPGVHLATFTPDPDPGLGIRCVSWHPSGMFIAVGGYDDKVRMVPTAQLFNRLSKLRRYTFWIRTAGRLSVSSNYPVEYSQEWYFFFKS